MPLVADLKKIKEELKKEKLSGILISSVANISYLTNYPHFSKEERDAYVLITPKNQYLITHDLYAEEVEKKVKDFKLIKVTPDRRTKQILEEVLGKKKKVGIEEYDLRVAELQVLPEGFKTKNKSISHIRAIKSDSEIDKLKIACQIGDDAFKHILKKIKIGISERRLARKLEDFIRHEGGEVAFPTIVSFGKNSSVPHHLPGEDTLDNKNGQFVLFDFGVKYKGYCSDMSRTVFFGKASEKQKKIYEVCLEAQKLASKVEGKDIKVSDVDRKAREYIEKEGYPSIPHALGHGVGLEVHELPHISPKSKDILKEGMVFTLEPGIYLPGFGGVRIEDVYLYKGGKFHPLTKSQKDIIEL